MEHIYVILDLRTNTIIAASYDKLEADNYMSFWNPKTGDSLTCGTLYLDLDNVDELGARIHDLIIAHDTQFPMTENSVELLQNYFLELCEEEVDIDKLSFNDIREIWTYVKLGGRNNEELF